MATTAVSASTSGLSSSDAPSVLARIRPRTSSKWSPSQVSFNYNYTSQRKAGMSTAIRAQQAETQSKALPFDDGGQWLSSTTRHIRIYAGYIDPVSLKMDQSQLDKLSLILDPDDEFIWPGDTPQKVFDKFQELVDNYAGSALTEYTLRLIGSDLEHFIRKMLFNNEIKYNLECRVLNFSMGKPRLNIEDDEEAEATT